MPVIFSRALTSAPAPSGPMSLWFCAIIEFQHLGTPVREPGPTPIHDHVTLRHLQVGQPRACSSLSSAEPHRQCARPMQAQRVSKRRFWHSLRPCTSMAPAAWPCNGRRKGKRERRASVHFFFRFQALQPLPFSIPQGRIKYLPAQESEAPSTSREPRPAPWPPLIRSH